MGLFKDVSDSGQYGFRYSKYLENVGSGVDVGFYFANYHSKVPYIQFNMPGNIFAGDALGAYLLASADAGTDLSELGIVTNNPGVYELNGTETVHKALSNAALSSGLCSAVMKANLRGVTASQGASNYATGNSEVKMRDNLMLQAWFTDQFDDGSRHHDASECYAAISTLGNAAMATNTTDNNLDGDVDLHDARLAKNNGVCCNCWTNWYGRKAICCGYSINFISYQGIFPEDNQILAASFSTNIGSTTEKVNWL